MAHPDYSLLIVETFDTGTSTKTTQSYVFSEVSDAQVAYKSEVATGGANKRVFLFEQPIPTKFKRGNNVPSTGIVDTWD